MAASVNWYETDNTTALGELQLGSIAPGNSYFGQNGSYVEARVKNDGDQDFAAVAVEIQATAFYTGHTHIRIAPDSGGSPGVWQAYGDGPLALGALAQGVAASMWIDVVVPAGADPDEGHASGLVVTGSV